MDRPHPTQTLNNNHPPGTDLEPTGKEEEGTAEEQLEKGPGGRLTGYGLQLKWRDWPRTESVGVLLWMAYAPSGQIGISK